MTKSADKQLVLDREDAQIATRSPMPAEQTMVHQPPTIAGILAVAVDKGMPPEAIEKLLAVYERMGAESARKEAAQDLAKFQAECPVIAKESEARITTRGGSQYGYKYAELDTIANTIRPHLAKYGLSYTWDSEVTRDERGTTITCTCTVRHTNGHSFSAKFSADTDTAAAMSGAQKNAAALTFARRQSLIQALGLTTGEVDNDGADTERVTEKQAATLRDLIEDVKADEAKFLKWANATSLADVLASKYQSAVQMLKAKKEKGQ